jgi:hypothetical protein
MVVEQRFKVLDMLLKSPQFLAQFGELVLNDLRPSPDSMFDRWASTHNLTGFHIISHPRPGGNLRMIPDCYMIHQAGLTAHHDVMA